MRFASFLSTTHYRWAALLWTLGIVAACLLPASTLQTVEPAVGVDKVVHFGLFAGFGALWMRVMCPPNSTHSTSDIRRRTFWFALAGAAFAVGTEGLQQVAPVRRVADPFDVVADLAGLVTAVAVYGYRAQTAGTSSKNG